MRLFAVCMLAIASAVACGRALESAPGTTPDAGGAPDALPPEASDAGARDPAIGACNGKWGVAEPATGELAAAGASMPRLSRDRLRAYHGRQNPWAFEVFLATRADASDDFASARKIPIASQYVYDPTTTADESRLFFSRPADGGNFRVGSVMLADAAATLTEDVFDGGVGEVDEGGPLVDEDEVLWFTGAPSHDASAMPTLYRAEIVDGSVATPMPVATGAAPNGWRNPLVLDHGKVLLVAMTSERRRIYVATRKNGGAFGDFAPLSLAEFGGDELPSFFDMATCTLYLTRIINGAHSIWTAARQRE